MTDTGNRIAQTLCRWYLRNGRQLPFRGTRDAYRILISEIMAQQTRITALIPYYERFTERFPTVWDLAKATEDEVLCTWQGLGYYSRARHLHETAKIVCEQYGGLLPADVEQLIKLPGIGAYTAGAIASIAFDREEPAIDGNALRVFARLFAIEEDVLNPKTRIHVHGLVHAMMRGHSPSVFTQAVMELGALICLPASPQCGICPLESQCEARQTGRADHLPIRTTAKMRRVEARLVLMLLSPSGEVLLRRRNERLLHNLWEFPGFDSYKALEEQLAVWNIAFGKTPVYGLCAKHVFTHLIWQMQGITIKAQNSPDIEGAVWAKAETLDDYAIPTALRAYKELVKQNARSTKGKEAL